MQSGTPRVEKKQLPHMLCVTNMLLHGIDDPSFVRHDNTLARPSSAIPNPTAWTSSSPTRPSAARRRTASKATSPPLPDARNCGPLPRAHHAPAENGGRAAVVLPDGSLFGEGVKTRIKEHLLDRVQPPHHRPPAQQRVPPLRLHRYQFVVLRKRPAHQDIWFYEHRIPEGQKAYSMTKPIRLEHLKPCIDWWGGAKRKGRKETEVAWKVSAKEVKARGYNLDIKNPHTVAEDHGDPEELLQKLDAAEWETANLRDQLKAILEKALLR
jgi:type I restriction enzyme M protein